MPEPQGNRPVRTGRFGRLSRTASFWILVFLIPVLILQFLNPGREEPAELTYSQFLEQLAQGNLLDVTIIEGKQIEGELKNAVTVQDRKAKRFRTLLPIKDSEELVATLQAKDVIIRAAEPRQNWWALFLSALPWIAIFGFWIFMLRQMQAGGSKAFQFGKSKARLLTGDTPKLTFTDVAGCDEAKEELQEIIEFLKDPQKFSRLGGRLPKGALLVGPPGTGKTLLAKAVAGEAARPFFSMSGSDFVEMFVGVGASRVRDLFEQGKAHAPCIIFIDEIDAVGRHRGAGLGGGHDEREQTLNQLLVEMDGFESNEGVILLAATNRPDVLDPALLRPGRFDRQIVVDMPDVKGREAILHVHLRKIPLADNVNVESLAKGTPGMSGADLANLVNEGALLAARRDRDRVANQDLEDAKDKVLLGAERKSMVLSEAERRLTAFHEAGHAVVALRLPGLDPVHKITIVPRGRALGLTASLPEEDRHSYSKDYLLAQLAMLFGGRAAEELVFGPEKITTGAGNDIERATILARRMVTQFGMSETIGPLAVGDAEHEVFLGRELVQRRELSDRTAELVDNEVKRMVDEAYGRALHTLESNRPLLERIADSLLERETLDREDVELLAAGRELPPLKPEIPAPLAPETPTEAGTLVPAGAAEEGAEAAGAEPELAPATAAREGASARARVGRAKAPDRSG
ncbi:MAG: ATP-dependent metallopeptidase FtsH/Yme1/Tma family protein [Gemmatimonadetes bacterium]|nr:ATP-dependent metallopeptidase FtsH/Yme1/Tma family protein [Gemmatimonadota bacterium]